MTAGPPSLASSPQWPGSRGLHETASAGDPSRQAAGTAAIVLCWNDSARVAALLDQLHAARPAPERVIVVDNGSTGDHASRLEQRLAQAEVVRLGCNRGFAAAANAGIRRALELGADWLWLLNTDIRLPGDALALLLAAASRDDNCGMAGAVLVDAGDGVVVWGGGSVSFRTGIARHARSASSRCDYLTGACVLMRAAMLRDIGLFDERYVFYWEDIELGFRARRAGWALAVAAGCRVTHDEGSTLGAWSSARWYHLFRGMSRFLETHVRFPRTVAAVRIAHHTVVMLRHGRLRAIAGAWRAAGAELGSTQWTASPASPSCDRRYPSEDLRS